jgi:hypothetical protein
MSVPWARLALACSLLASGPVRGEGRLFFSQASGAGIERALLRDAITHRQGELTGFFAVAERIDPAGTRTRRYFVQCQRSAGATPGVWLDRTGGTERFEVLVEPERPPEARDRFAYNLWWAVCRQVFERY